MADITLETYRITLIGPDPAQTNAGWKGPIVATSFGLSKSLLEEVEENINDLLPEGYKVRIQ